MKLFLNGIINVLLILFVFSIGANSTARVNIPNQPIGVVVVHFHPTNPFDDKDIQDINTRARHREAKEAFNAAKSFDYPTVIMGDFNDIPGSTPYELFASTFQDAAQVVGKSNRKTWPSVFPVTQIDYIWVSKRIHGVNCQTMKSRASDHLPLVADIQLVHD